jgi:uncharacterized membrane protein
MYSAPQFAMLLTLYWHFPIVARRMARDMALKKRFNNYSKSVQNRLPFLFKNTSYPQKRSRTRADTYQERERQMHQWSAGAWGTFGWPWPGIVWLIAFLLFWGGLLALLIWAVRLSAGSRRDNRESNEEILRRRLANGEISPEEYERILNMLHD